MPSYDDQTLRQLLDLQREDTAIIRLHERRASLPEARRLQEVQDLVAELEADLDIARKQNDEIAREQSRLEGEIELIDQKAAREDQRMMSGKVANPKELAALQAEIESLKRRRAGIEDQLLDVMVARDAATETVERLDSERSEAQRQKDELSAAVTRLTGDIEAELGGHSGARDEAAAAVPEELLSMYEQIRASKHGVGAAALMGGTCQGCHTKLPAVEAERIRKEKGLQRCDNCRRILIVV